MAVDFSGHRIIIGSNTNTEIIKTYTDVPLNGSTSVTVTVDVNPYSTVFARIETLVTITGSTATIQFTPRELDFDDFGNPVPAGFYPGMTYTVSDQNGVVSTNNPLDVFVYRDFTPIYDSIVTHTNTILQTTDPGFNDIITIVNSPSLLDPNTGLIVTKEPSGILATFSANENTIPQSSPQRYIYLDIESPSGQFLGEELGFNVLLNWPTPDPNVIKAVYIDYEAGFDNPYSFNIFTSNLGIAESTQAQVEFIDIPANITIGTPLPIITTDGDSYSFLAIITASAPGYYALQYRLVGDVGLAGPEENIHHLNILFYIPSIPPFNLSVATGSRSVAPGLSFVTAGTVIPGITYTDTSDTITYNSTTIQQPATPDNFYTMLKTTNPNTNQQVIFGDLIPMRFYYSFIGDPGDIPMDNILPPPVLDVFFFESQFTNLKNNSITLLSGDVTSYEHLQFRIKHHMISCVRIVASRFITPNRDRDTVEPGVDPNYIFSNLGNVKTVEYVKNNTAEFLKDLCSPNRTSTSDNIIQELIDEMFIFFYEMLSDYENGKVKELRKEILSQKFRNQFLVYKYKDTDRVPGELLL